MMSATVGLKSKSELCSFENYLGIHNNFFLSTCHVSQVPPCPEALKKQCNKSVKLLKFSLKNL